LRQETSTIPIIFGNIVDPIGQGLVTSMAQPGGNVTGFVNLEPSVTGKYLELLKEIAPRVSHAAIFYNPATAPYHEIYLSRDSPDDSRTGVNIRAFAALQQD
jgi:putative ABC transport system substrate-binding protein